MQANKVVPKIEGDGRLLDTKSAAEYLGIAPQWLRMSRMKKPTWDGPIPVYLTRRTIRYRLSDLDSFIDERRAAPSAGQEASA